jgi:hypothetical protein
MWGQPPSAVLRAQLGALDVPPRHLAVSWFRISFPSFCVSPKNF